LEHSVRGGFEQTLGEDLSAFPDLKGKKGEIRGNKGIRG
jgi:hypothetical protein